MSGRFLSHVTIPLELAREAITAIEREGFQLNCYVDDFLYMAKMTPEAHAYAEHQRIPLEEVGDLLEWLSSPPTKLVAIGDPKALDGLAERLREQFDERMYISKSLPFFLELASPEVSKGAGLGFAAERLGFTPPRRWPSATARTTSSCSTGPATRSPSRMHMPACWPAPTSSARRYRKRASRR